MNRISHNRRLHVTIINRDDDARHDDRHNKNRGHGAIRGLYVISKFYVHDGLRSVTAIA